MEEKCLKTEIYWATIHNKSFIQWRKFVYKIPLDMIQMPCDLKVGYVGQMTEVLLRWGRIRLVVESSWNVMAHGNALAGEEKGETGECSG